MSKKIRYVGPYEAVAVPQEGGDIVVQQNHQVEVDDDLAKSLLAQADNWEAATESKKEKE